jgi:hypothetical protein
MKKLLTLCIFCTLFIVTVIFIGRTSETEIPKGLEWINEYKINKTILLLRDEGEMEKQRITSPDAHYTLYQKENPNPIKEYPDDFQIWLMDIKTNHIDQLVYEYKRSCYVLWSPDSRKIIINDHAGSDLATTSIFMINETDGTISEIGTGLYGHISDMFFDITKDIWKNNTYNDKYPYDHYYMDAIGWSPNSSEVLVKAWGHTHSCSGGPCYFIYSLKDNKVTHHLKFFRRIEEEK